MTATQLITGDIAPGLADPPHDAQRIFRAVLDAFAQVDPAKFSGMAASTPPLSSRSTA